jgi:hypothetical protein
MTEIYTANVQQNGNTHGPPKITVMADDSLDNTAS